MSDMGYVEVRIRYEEEIHESDNHLSLCKLDRLEALVAELNRYGIYVGGEGVCKVVGSQFVMPDDGGSTYFELIVGDPE